MSAEAMGWVFRHSPYKGATFIIHLAIGDVANDDHGNLLFMYHRTIARKARVGLRSVTAAVATMVSDGLLEVVSDATGPGKPAQYRFLMPVTHANGACEHTQSVQQHTQTVRALPEGTVSSNSKNSNYHLAEYTEDEETIWKLYPKRAGQNPKRAGIENYRKWITAGVEPTSLLSAVQAYAATNPEPEYTMMAQTFFGPNERWRDFLAVEGSNPETPRRVQPIETWANAWWEYQETGFWLDSERHEHYGEPPEAPELDSKPPTP